MESAKFRGLRFASLLLLGASTLSAAIAGESHRVWIDPPSDLLAEAAPGDWSEPSARRESTEAISAESEVATKSGGSNDHPSETGSIGQPDAGDGTLAKAPDDGGNGARDGQAAEAGGASKQRNTRTASREDPPVAEPVPARRTGLDREHTRAAPRQAARRAHRIIRRSAPRSSFIERIFGPPRRGANVISTGSIR